MTKIEAARQEYADWCEAIGITRMSDVNDILAEGNGIGLVNLCEARQERKYMEVADQIFWRRKECRFVMMSGPSSSGKTSSSLRIAQQCRVLGLIPKVIELDNYFVDRDKTPRDENGEYDYEHINAMDIEVLNRDLNDLLDGKEIELPRFNFTTGYREPSGKFMKLEDNECLFMEGIHALNPALTPYIDQKKIFHVYISALSSLKDGDKDHYSTTDKRLLRRIVRDNRVRNISPESTILRWPSVRRGEIKNIFPYEENADIVFNSSTLYDIPLLRYYSEPLLYAISEGSPAYEKAQDLIRFMSKVTPLKPEEIAAIPPTSIMREFIGGQKLV